MFIVKSVSPDEAQGKIAEIYKGFPAGMPIPETLQLLSASETLMGFQAGAIGWWMEHKTLPPHLLAAIRYNAAGTCDNGGCINFNGGMLQAGGLTEADLQTIATDPLNGPFEARENALLAFVATAMKEPEKINEGWVAELRSMDWTDQDIFEATFHATAMLGPSALLKIFKK